HAAVRQSLAAVRITLFPQPAALRPWPTRETLARHDARRPRRISLRDGAQRDRAYTATGGLHTFGRTRQRRRGCAEERRAQAEGAARTRNPSCRGNSRGVIAVPAPTCDTLSLPMILRRSAGMVCRTAAALRLPAGSIKRRLCGSGSASFRSSA